MSIWVYLGANFSRGNFVHWPSGTFLGVDEILLLFPLTDDAIKYPSFSIIFSAYVGLTTEQPCQRPVDLQRSPCR